jgi:hypothetical protein
MLHRRRKRWDTGIKRFLFGSFMIKPKPTESLRQLVTFRCKNLVAFMLGVTSFGVNHENLAHVLSAEIILGIVHQLRPVSTSPPDSTKQNVFPLFGYFFFVNNYNIVYVCAIMLRSLFSNSQVVTCKVSRSTQECSVTPMRDSLFLTSYVGPEEG